MADADATSNATSPEAVPATEDDSSPIGWLEDLLKPGVGPGVFSALKLSLVGLIFILLFMLYGIEEPVWLCCAHTRSIPLAVLDACFFLCRMSGFIYMSS